MKYNKSTLDDRITEGIHFIYNIVGYMIVQTMDTIDKIKKSKLEKKIKKGLGSDSPFSSKPNSSLTDYAKQIRQDSNKPEYLEE